MRPPGKRNHQTRERIRSRLNLRGKRGASTKPSPGPKGIKREDLCCYQGTVYNFEGGGSSPCKTSFKTTEI